MISKKRNINVKFVEANPNIKSYDERLEYLLQAVRDNQNSIIVASEVYLSDFDYDNIEEASKFSEYAIDKLKDTAEDQIIIFTVIRKTDNLIVNQAIAISGHKVVHTQEKVKLFKLGSEDKYFAAGKTDVIRSFEINGLKIGILICFELRFKEFWKILEGCDMVIVPAKWGILREMHFKILSNALSVMNQCFVIAHSSGSKDIVNSSTIYSPSGLVVSDIDLGEITKTRRYIVME